MTEVVIDSAGRLFVFARDVSVLMSTFPELEGAKLPAHLGTGPVWCCMGDPVEFGNLWTGDPPMPQWWFEAGFDAVIRDATEGAGPHGR